MLELPEDAPGGRLTTLTPASPLASPRGGHLVTLGDVIAALRASVDRLPFSELANALDEAEEAHALVEQAAAGSGQAEFYQVLEWFRLVVEGIGDLQRQLSAIQASVTDTANRLEGSGRTSEPLAPSVPASPATPSAKPMEARAAELLSKLPAREGNNYKTAGVWIDGHGKEREPLVSGRDEGYAEAKKMLKDLRIGPARGDLLTAAHVEVKLAAHLRKTEAKAVTLVINNRPCLRHEVACVKWLHRIGGPILSEV